MEIAYYMRGGATYEEVMNMSASERDVASDFINSRIQSLKDDPRMTIPI